MTDSSRDEGAPAPSGATGDNAAVARSAGAAFLGRLGGLIDIVSLVVFGWLYGAATMGIFFVLWAVIRISTRFTEFGMPTALQRFVPESDCRERSASIIKSALSVALLLSVSLAALGAVMAPVIAELVHADAEDAAHVVSIIRIYAWVLPFWTLLEVLTASVRAQRHFGPEVRIRVFYEQGLRFLAGVGFWMLGFHSKGLFLAHLVSAVVAALLALRLSAKFYDYRAVWSERFDWKLTRRMLSYAYAIAPVGIIRDLHAELPVLLLNQLLPGAQGASAAGLYGTARRIASPLLVVRQSFEYVIAPYATIKRAAQQHGELQEMYAFSTRVICCLIVPLAALLVLVRDEILMAFAPDFAQASGIILILALARMIEALTGPANALVEMLGHRLLPLLNGIAGVTVLIVLQFVLTPEYGALGAATAVAVGVNVTSTLSLIEAYFLYDLQPYSRALVRPFAIAIVSTLLMAWLGSLIGLGALAGPAGSAELTGADRGVAVVAVYSLGILVTLALIVRYGLRAEDAHALGSIGRWLRGST